MFHKNFSCNDFSFENVDGLLVYVKEISEEGHDFLCKWFDSKQYIEVSTSGTTGKPKTIQIQKHYMQQSALMTGKYFGILENTKVLMCLSPSYIAGKMMWVRALTLGWHLTVVLPKSNPLQEIDGKFDFCAMVPMQLYHSLEKINLIKKVLVGGGAVAAAVVEKIQEVSACVYASYGMTETVSHIAIKKLNHTCKNSNYQVLPGVEISVDSRGCLVIDAPAIASEKIVTNDLVSIEGNIAFQWLGRFDNVINSGGVKLCPEAIEAKINSCIKEQFFVSSIPDSLLGEKLILIVEAEKIDKKNLQKSLEKLLLKYECPKEIYCFPKFIETATHKIARKQTLEYIIAPLG